MAGLHDRAARAAVAYRIDGPVVALAEQGANRNGQHIIALPGRHMDDHAELVAQTRPAFPAAIQVDGYLHALLLDAQRRYLEKAGRIDPPDAALECRTTPTVDSNRRTRLDL